MQIISIKASLVDSLECSGKMPTLLHTQNACGKDEPLSREKTIMEIKWPDSSDDSLGPILFDNHTIRKRVLELGASITQDYHGRTPHLICILKGASIFHADLVRSIDLVLSFDFIAVASYGKRTKSSGEVRILKDLDESIEGKDVLLVEDIVDTGLTLHYLLQNLKNRSPKTLKTVALLNKPSRREIDVPVEYIGFDIRNDFVVGYGLDLDQRFRNLPDIYVLQNS